MARPNGVWFLRMSLTLGLVGAAPMLAKQVCSFECDEPGRLPLGFEVASDTWNIVQDGNNLVLAQQAESGAKVFNLMLAMEPRIRDLTISARLKRVSGKVDQGGRIVSRALDKENYYIARFNPLEDNLRLYKFENGKRSQLNHADAPGDSQWHAHASNLDERTRDPGLPRRQEAPRSRESHLS